MGTLFRKNLSTADEIGGQQHVDSRISFVCILFIGRISGAGDISAAEHTSAVRVCHTVLRVIDHLFDRMGDEHCLFDAAGETQGGR